MSWTQANEYSELYEEYEGTWQERPRPTRANYKPKKSKQQILTEIAETDRVEAGLKITYKPARFEEEWLLNSIKPFFERGLLEDVLAQVKGGKEANVYSCRSAKATGLGVVAAKVYRPRQFRNLSNDSTYREGREFLAAAGGILRNRNTREMRAIKNKTEFGAELMHQSWLMHEYTTLETLYQAGAAVPQPVSAGENAMLMQFLGEEGRAAPILHAVTLAHNEVQPLFSEVMRNIELMLSKGMIHGDLSAFNILYWQGKITMIDFPQVTMALKNRAAYKILQRDVQRVCEYFAGQGLTRNADAITDQLWDRHVGFPPNRRWDDPVAG